MKTCDSEWLTPTWNPETARWETMLWAPEHYPGGVRFRSRARCTGLPKHKHMHSEDLREARDKGRRKGQRITVIV